MCTYVQFAKERKQVNSRCETKPKALDILAVMWVIVGSKIAEIVPIGSILLNQLPGERCVIEGSPAVHPATRELENGKLKSSEALRLEEGFFVWSFAVFSQISDYCDCRGPVESQPLLFPVKLIVNRVYRQNEENIYAPTLTEVVKWLAIGVPKTYCIWFFQLLYFLQIF